MLIIKNISPGDIVTIKLNHEEIIARLIEEDLQYYILAKPMVFVVTQQGPSLMPYVFTIDAEDYVKINKSTLNVSIMKTEKSFASQYIELTTGLKVV